MSSTRLPYGSDGDVTVSMTTLYDDTARATAGTTATNVGNIAQHCVSVDLLFGLVLGNLLLILKNKAVYCHLQCYRCESRPVGGASMLGGGKR